MISDDLPIKKSGMSTATLNYQRVNLECKSFMPCFECSTFPALDADKNLKKPREHRNRKPVSPPPSQVLEPKFGFRPAMAEWNWLVEYLGNIP